MSGRIERLSTIAMACRRTTKQLVECSPSGLSTKKNTPMKQLIRKGLLGKGLTMYTVIRRYEDQAFDDEHFIVQKQLQPVPRHGIFEQAETKWRLETPSK